MKRTRLFFFAAACAVAFCSSYLHATEKANPAVNPHAKDWNEKDAVKLHGEMSRMENNYLRLSDMVSSGNIEDNAVKDTLNRIQESVRKMRMAKPGPSLEQSLNELSNQVSSINNLVWKQDPITLRKKVDDIYVTCFRCHVANRPGYRPSKE